MSRTESVVIQVAPSHENDKIREMALFGWELYGRQEMAVAGNTTGTVTPGMFGGGTVTLTTQVRHYVKLHFARSLAMPGLEFVRGIEAEYFRQPFPKAPAPALPAGLAVVLAFIAINTFPYAACWVCLLLCALCGGWIWLCVKQRQEAEEVCAASLKRRQELVAQLYHRYAAIAYSPSTRRYASAHGFPRQAEAEQAALARCGGADARVLTWSRNAWCALALADDGASGGCWADTAAAAGAAAVAACRKHTTAPCSVVTCVHARQ
jgi:hypothetical protein